MRLLLIPILLLGCASAPPTDAQVWHRIELRPGTVAAADDAETALLERLSALESDASGTDVDVAGRRFSLGPLYLAASGRRCRRIAGAEASLACSDGTRWHYAPSVFGDAP